MRRLFFFPLLHCFLPLPLPHISPPIRRKRQRKKSRVRVGRKKEIVGHLLSLLFWENKMFRRRKKSPPRNPVRLAVCSFGGKSSTSHGTTLNTMQYTVPSLRKALHSLPTRPRPHFQGNRLVQDTYATEGTRDMTSVAIGWMDATLGEVIPGRKLTRQSYTRPRPLIEASRSTRRGHLEIGSHPRKTFVLSRINFCQCHTQRSNMFFFSKCLSSLSSDLAWKEECNPPPHPVKCHLSFSLPLRLFPLPFPRCLPCLTEGRWVPLHHQLRFFSRAHFLRLLCRRSRNV